jgi:hypothetical protein
MLTTIWSSNLAQEEMLAVQERDGKLKPEQEDVLCYKLKIMMTKLI